MVKVTPESVLFIAA